MCNFCNCFGWILEQFNRFVTWGLGCLIMIMICIGLLVTLTAGVTYGYNYSIAEFMHIARTEMERFAKLKPKSARLGGYMTLLNPENRLDRPKGFQFQRTLDENDYTQMLAMRRNEMNMNKPPNSPYEGSMRDEARPPLKVEPVPETYRKTGVFLKDLFPARPPETAVVYEEPRRPAYSPNEQDATDDKKRRPFIFTNAKDSREQIQVSLRPTPTQYLPTPVEEQKKLKPFMLSNIKDSAEVEAQTKSKGVLPDIPDYGEYGEEETASKKPI